MDSTVLQASYGMQDVRAPSLQLRGFRRVRALGASRAEATKMGHGKGISWDTVYYGYIYIYIYLFIYLFIYLLFLILWWYITM